MIDTEEQIEFDDVLREIEVGVDISEGNYDILRYYRDEYKDLLAEVKRLREKNEEFGYQLVEAIGLLKMSVRVTKDGRRHHAERFERQTNAMLGREMIE